MHAQFEKTLPPSEFDRDLVSATLKEQLAVLETKLAALGHTIPIDALMRHPRKLAGIAWDDLKHITLLLRIVSEPLSIDAIGRYIKPAQVSENIIEQYVRKHLPPEIARMIVRSNRYKRSVHLINNTLK